MTNNFMGRSQINECPHKTVSRFYDTLPVKLWRCDWCGAEFRAVEVGASKTVELTEVGTAEPARVVTVYPPHPVVLTPEETKQLVEDADRAASKSASARKKEKSFAS